MLGVLDYFAGPDLSFLIFYVAPGRRVPTREEDSAPATSTPTPDELNGPGPLTTIDLQFVVH